MLQRCTIQAGAPVRTNLTAPAELLGDEGGCVPEAKGL